MLIFPKRISSLNSQLYPPAQYRCSHWAAASHQLEVPSLAWIGKALNCSGSTMSSRSKALNAGSDLCGHAGAVAAGSGGKAFLVFLLAGRCGRFSLFQGKELTQVLCPADPLSAGQLCNGLYPCHTITPGNTVPATRGTNPFLSWIWGDRKGSWRKREWWAEYSSSSQGAEVSL